MRCMFTAPMVALALFPAGSRAIEPIQDLGRASVAGRYVQESEAGGESQLLLQPDGRYEPSVDVGLNREKIRTIRGGWTVSGQGVLLTQQTRDPRKPAFVPTKVMPWSPGTRLKQRVFNIDPNAAQVRGENPRAAEVGAETLAVDASKGRTFFVRADSFAVLPDSFAEIPLILEDGALVSARSNVRYVRH